MRKGLDRKSIKESGGVKSKKLLDGSTHLGKLMQKYSGLEEVLYPYLVRTDWVFDEMDFTIAEFADIAAASTNDLIQDLTEAIENR